jgi:hypothetical protein
MLRHVTETWRLRTGGQPREHLVMHRDGWRCITGRAPAALRFELALEIFACGDVLVVERAVT